MQVSRTGCMFIVSGPSGAGKTSICTPALARVQGLQLSISVTTRRPRGREVDGVDYRFVTADRFQSMVDAGEFAEWAEVHGNRYGTSRKDLEDAVNAGRDVLLDIDVQGAGQIQRAYPEAVAIFLLPPSRSHLEQRLRGRGTDDEGTVQRRLANAFREISGLGSYDHLIINHDLEAALEDFLAVVRAERSRVTRIAGDDLRRLIAGFAPTAAPGAGKGSEGGGGK